MKIKVNNTRYKVVEVDKVILKNDKSEDIYLGACDYTKEKIQVLRKLSKPKKTSVLIHELAHAHMFENGHTKESFTLEEVCDLFGAYAERIVDDARKVFGK